MQPTKLTLNRSVIEVLFPEVASSWEQWILLTADRHHDNRNTDIELERSLLEKARKRSAFIIDAGDLFDCMQGRYDPRKSWPDMREDLALQMIQESKSYYDVVLEEAQRFYLPYSDLYLVMARGNHETAIIRHHEIDLTQRLVSGLNQMAGTSIQAGGYGGWVRFRFENVSATSKLSKNLKYYHGSKGTDAPVTRGVIQSNRQAVYLPDADIVFNGHNHESWIVPITRERLLNSGRVVRDIQWHVRVPTVKDDYGDGHSGWAVESGHPPRPLGAAWLHFTYENHEIHVSPHLDLS